MNKLPPIQLTFDVYVAISKLLESAPDDKITDHLFNEIDRATLVPDAHLPNNIVSINSTVTFTVQSTGKSFTYRLVYPQDLDNSENQLSILSPVGAALIGMQQGQAIYWPISPDKETWIVVCDVN